MNYSSTLFSVLCCIVDVVFLFYLYRNPPLEGCVCSWLLIILQTYDHNGSLSSFLLCISNMDQVDMWVVSL